MGEYSRGIIALLQTGRVKPWMEPTHDGYILCLQCVTHLQTSAPKDQPARYLACRVFTRSYPRLTDTNRRKFLRWQRKHRRCGFEGMMQ